MAVVADPPLALDHIQGIAVPGFFKPHQALLLLHLPSPDPKPALGELLRMLDAGLFSTGRQALDDRARFREVGADGPGLLRAIGFTSSGLDHTAHGLAAAVPSVAFRGGMAARAGLLGDDGPGARPLDPLRPMPHLLLVVAGNDAPAVSTDADGLAARLIARGAKLLGSIQHGNVRASAPGREHFGFADGISQPGIRGVDATGHPITPRHLPTSDPEHDLFGLPGQHLVWPGEFVLGYPGASPDPRLPGPVRPVPDWMHDGSFLVYRRLQQHVHLFRRTMAELADQLRSRPGFATMTKERLAALLVGRWPSGAPVSRSPQADCPALGTNALLNNDFRFDDDTPVRQRDIGPSPRPAGADPLGLVCPVASHIRKVNLRDQASDVGGASATLSRRILRVGVPYGPEVADGETEATEQDRGLLFLSIQASIEDQFEFLQARWINSRVRPRGPGGDDMLVGRNAAPPDGARRCLVFGDGMVRPTEVVATEPFVTMTGGGYFFVPSLTTLRALLEGTPLPP